MKQETLEEAAENAFNNFKRENPIVPQKHILPYKLGYMDGAKWQAKRMYSEEEIIKAYYDRNDEIDVDGYWVDDPEKDIKRLIKQLKKK
jgi:hypothetical protein